MDGGSSGKKHQHQGGGDDEQPVAKMTAAKFARRYTLGKELGRGEFVVTRRCKDAAMGEALACMTIRKASALGTGGGDSGGGRARGGRAEGGGHESPSLTSPVAAVVRLWEAREDADSTVHLVMGLCEGGELFDRIVVHGHCSERAAAKIFRIVVSAFHNPGNRFTEVVGSAYYMAPEVLKWSYSPEMDVWSAGVIALHGLA